MKEVTDLIYRLHKQNEDRFTSVERELKHTNLIALGAARGVEELQRGIDDMTMSLQMLANKRLGVSEEILTETNKQTTTLAQIKTKVESKWTKFGAIIGTIAATAVATMITTLIEHMFK